MNGLNGERLWRSLMVIVILLLPARAWAVQATLMADAHVSQTEPTVNAGGLSNLNVGGGYTSLVQFDLGVLPAGTTAAQISRATLRLYCNRADTPGAVSVQPVYGGWTEFGVTYATMPVLGTTLGSMQVAGAGRFVTLDVTAQVQGWVGAPGSNFGLALSSLAAAVQFDSKENDQTAHLPQLEIALAAGSSGSSQGGVGVVGATGATGSAGIAGATGATGAAGAPGVAGPSGVTGATGPAGPAGAGLVNYQGTYNSLHNYANGDVVVFAGSTYISQTASNHGNTPGVLPTYWGLLASVGATGPVGAQGATGAMGQQGPVGYGVQGMTGATGGTGATGAVGSPGLVYRGAYSSTTNYTSGDVVLWNGSSFVSMLGFNLGNTPGLVPGTWGPLTAQGPTGFTGATGVAGPMGPTGSLGPVGPPGYQGNQGAQGIPGQPGAQGLPGVTGATGIQGPIGYTGPAGPVGLSFQGNYNATTNYSLGQGVLWQGSGWVSLIYSNHGNTPDQSPSAWAMFAAQGNVGLTGATGMVGATGAIGVTGATGTNGLNGTNGATGATGASGLVYQGAYSSTTNYALGDVVVWSGSSYASMIGSNLGNTPGAVPGTWGLLTAQGAAGVAGAPGAVGPTGATGTMGPMGSPGPQGPQGPQGAPGIVGAAGSPGAAGATGATGAAGPIGATGVAGPGGAQGLPGATGVTGSQGLLGATGPAGPVGLSFQGSYSATTNYSMGQGVLWQGASWVSLTNSNVGNTPDASPGYWSMFAAAGSTGATGPVGLQYQGAYSSTTNYALGDVAVWAGSSYTSLINANHGNTPGTVPGTWGLLSAQGATGAAGPTGYAGATGATGAAGTAGAAGATGAQGAAGAMGPAGAAGTPGATGATGAAGAAGPVGATGVAGPAGAQGLPGTTGAAGPQGTMGATGPIGPVGLSFQGTYSSTTNYSLGQGVLWQGAGWVSLTNSNLGNTPDSSPIYWAMFASQGATGVTGATGIGVAGATGATGGTGAVGAAGVQGATGATGATGLNFIGPYSSTYGYSIGDGVSYNGASYVSLIGGNHGQTPGSSPSYWALLAAPGGTGATGAMGATGLTGASGAVGAVGTTGSTGPAGATGAQGAIGINFRGAWNQGARYAANDATTFAGTTYLAIAQGSNQEPDQYPQAWAVLAEAGGVGPTGVAGATGAAASVAVGTVTTLPAGSQATVTNSGTSSAAVLNFGLPQGATGSGGSTGSTAPREPAMYHAVSFSYTYYAVNTAASSATESGAVLAWMPQACTASRLDVYSQQSGTIKVTLRVGTAASLSSTALACSVSPNSSCTSTGSVAVSAGQFMDLYIQFSSGTAAGVWTSVQCE